MVAPDSLAGQQFDVTVIGAGVAGTTAAMICARNGLRTLLLERQTFPRHKICGCCLNGRAVQVLDQLGLGDQLRKLSGSTTSSLAIRLGGKSLNIAMPSSVAVSRQVLDSFLFERAVSAGCQFLDGVTASVVPVASDEYSMAEHQALAPENENARFRQIEVRNSAVTARDPNLANPAPAVLTSKIVLVCDGLGHSSLSRLSGFKAIPKPHSRIGLGAVFPRMGIDNWLKPGEVLMAVSSRGYAGLVEIEDEQWNLAAAVDAAELNRTKSPLKSLISIFESAGVPVPAGLTEASIKGTVPLTRTAERLAGQRLFLLGDSTGYVEPFTGEGMAWALSAANAVAPLVSQAVRKGWSDDMMGRWNIAFRDVIGREQSICRFLSAVLRRPWLLPPVMSLCRTFPALTQRLVRQINRVPEALEIS